MTDRPFASPRVKICGLQRLHDARTAAAAGAAYVGAVHVPGTPRHVEPREARRISEAVDLPLVLVVAGEAPERVAALAREAGASIVQLHGEEPPETVEAVRAAGSWDVWAVVRVRDAEDAERRIASLNGSAQGILLDTWESGRLGGTGKRFPWEALAEIRGLLAPGTLLVAAGGLRADNVGEAVRVLRPDVVDVSSGVEAAPGRKSAALIRGFVRAAHGAVEVDPETGERIRIS